MFKNFSAKTGGPLSMGTPDPLNARPSISSLIGMLRTSPVNSQWVYRLSIPLVPSKICTTAFFPAISSTYLTSIFISVPLSHWSVSQTNVYDFCVLWELHVVQDNQRTINLYDCSVIDLWGDIVIPCCCRSVNCSKVGINLLRFLMTVAHWLKKRFFY